MINKMASLNYIFWLKSSLPEQVFKEPKVLLFNEFYSMLDNEMWPLLQYLAKKNNDQAIYVSDISRVRRTWKGEKNIISIPVTTHKKNYLSIMDNHSLNVEPEQIIWFSDSASWGIWAERTWDICILNNDFSNEYFGGWEKLNQDVLELIQDKWIRGEYDQNIDVLKRNYK
ncbi:hypothetical protein GKZ89_18335 [Bacillus mangrovi]|uniref:Uncharacterized protein n=1 Tax=Metabacillus mangrovi TaxID=1491830 RepID=A0A7X2SA56_9BACI|nr:hypothetical protein [Metabacillus mangrovi]MTH55356.1 hypothetical protein [Metabacillus mangrovi]